MAECNGWHNLNLDWVVEKGLKEKLTAQELAKQLKDLAEVKSGGIASDASLEKALDKALAEIQQKAEEWCKKQFCFAGKCRNVDFDVQIQSFEDASYEWTVMVSITKIECTCSDTNIIIIRPKGKKRSAIALKEKMKEGGLTPGQIEKINNANCILSIRKKSKVTEKENEKKEKIQEVKIINYAECIPNKEKPCEEGKKCKLIKYSIGDDEDTGKEVTTPFDMDDLEEGYFVLCECR